MKAVADFALARGLHLFIRAGTSVWMLFEDMDHMRRWWNGAQAR